MTTVNGECQRVACEVALRKKGEINNVGEETFLNDSLPLVASHLKKNGGTFVRGARREELSFLHGGAN